MKKRFLCSMRKSRRAKRVRFVVYKKPFRAFSRADYLKHKEAARALVHEKVAHYNSIYGHTLGTISIRNQKTRWGSCSKKLNLNFNYKILFLPRDLQDYIIIHELCHLKELNHSRNFWNLVAKTLPYYRGLREELKKYALYSSIQAGHTPRQYHHPWFGAV